MSIVAHDVAQRVELGLASIADEAVVSALRAYLVTPPRACWIEWDYGEPGERFPGFIIAELGDTGTGIAYCEHGFGPVHPWGLVFLDTLASGMDSGWFATLEGAFRESRVWNEPPPPGYEVE